MADTSGSIAGSGPPAPTPIAASGRLGTLVVVGLAAAIVAFGLGYRLGPGPAPSPTPHASQLSSPSPPDVQPGSVSDRLRAAYRAGASDWATCTLAAVPSCVPLNHMLYGLASDPREFAPSSTLTDWESLGPRKVQGPRLVLVADLHADAGLAFVSAVAAPGSASPPPDRQLPQVAASDGVFYFDLGSLAPGRYVVVVGGLAAFDRSAIRPPRASSTPSGWWTYEAAFEVR